MKTKMFKLTRLSETNRPDINEQCFFSPSIYLGCNTYIIDNRKMLKSYLRENNICTVIKHGDKVEIVIFNNQKDTDIVSADFLLRKELTNFGVTILGTAKNG